MKAVNVIMVVVCALLLVAVVVILVVAVTTHTEPGFMQERPVWSRSDAPLSICAHGYAGSDDAAVDAVTSAAHVTNERLGFEVYGEVGVDDDGCDVRVTVGVPTESGWRDPGGDAVFDAHRLTGIRCDVTTSNTGTDTMLWLVLQHELGHCLGLDHDGYRGSIMFGGPGLALETPSAGEYPPRISDSDRDLLRQRYMP